MSNFIKKRPQHRFFFCEFCEKFLRMFYFSQNTTGRLLLDVSVTFGVSVTFSGVSCALLVHSSAKFDVIAMLGEKRIKIAF